MSELAGGDVKQSGRYQAFIREVVRHLGSRPMPDRYVQVGWWDKDRGFMHALHYSTAESGLTPLYERQWPLETDPARDQQDDPSMAGGRVVRRHTRDAIGRALMQSGRALHKVGLWLCGVAGWWDAGTDG